MTYTIFGESHGPAIGVVLEGVPSGVEMDLDFIRAELQRRAPGKSALTTARKEADEPEILSGVFDGKTTGTPLCAIIRNTDTRSKDYAKLKHLPRPSHADYAGAVRYGGFNDYRGGGHFSGRLTAPLVFAGALAKLILQEKGVIITSAISILEGTPDPSPEEIEEIILAARKAGDSVGGAISCTVTGISAGFGAPDFGCNAEGIFAQHLFAVPAVKGIAFGAGFHACAAVKPTIRFIWKKGRSKPAPMPPAGSTAALPMECPLCLKWRSVPRRPSLWSKIRWIWRKKRMQRL